MIYLDHNATTPLDHRVLEAMMPYLKDSTGATHPARTVLRIGQKLPSKRRVIKLPNAPDANLPTLSLLPAARNQTTSRCVGWPMRFDRRGNHIVTTAIEHHAVLNTCKALEADGYRVTYLPVNSSGSIDIKDVEKQPDTANHPGHSHARKQRNRRPPTCKGNCRAYKTARNSFSHRCGPDRRQAPAPVMHAWSRPHFHVRPQAIRAQGVCRTLYS